jgi:hypothetical protein
MKGGFRGDEHSLAYTAERASYGFEPNISQGTTLNSGQIPYNVVVPYRDVCGASCGQAIANINNGGQMV